MFLESSQISDISTRIAQNNEPGLSSKISIFTDSQCFFFHFSPNFTKQQYMKLMQTVPTMYHNILNPFLPLSLSLSCRSTLQRFKYFSGKLRLESESLSMSASYKDSSNKNIPNAGIRQRSTNMFLTRNHRCIRLSIIMGETKKFLRFPCWAT